MNDFAKAVLWARKQKKMNQKELAAKILKKDGTPISPQYLSDIEHGRRRPCSELLIDQFSILLDIDSNCLYLLAGMIPPKLRKLIQSFLGAC